MFHAEACDLFDLLAFLTRETMVHTRAERAAKTRDESKLFERCSRRSSSFLEFILEKYERTGCVELSRKSLANLVQLAGQGTITQLSKSFGGAQDLLQAFVELQHELYHCV